MQDSNVEEQSNYFDEAPFSGCFFYIVTTSKFWSWIVTSRKISKLALSTGSQKKQ